MQVQITDWLITEEADLMRLPSINKNFSPKDERLNRLKGVNIILDVGKRLKLRTNPTLATAAVYFHRFYLFHKFQDYDFEFTALTALFLGGKVEDTPKKIESIVTEAKALEIPKISTFESTKDISEIIVAVERLLVQTLKFDLILEHPHKYLAKYLKALEEIPTDQKDEFAQTAIGLANDSLYTTLCIEWEPQIIAIAFINETTRKINAKRETDKKVTLKSDWYNVWVDNLYEYHLKKITTTMDMLYAEFTA